MIRNIALAALVLCLSSAVRAEGDAYAAIKPLIGSWLVDRDCKVYKDKVLVAFTKGPKAVVAEFRDPKKPAVSWGKADIVPLGEEDRYRVLTVLPNNPMLKTMGVKSITGTMVVSDDADEPEGPGKDYITVSSRVSMLTSLLTIKLRDGYKTATFIFKTESPLGAQTCRGAGKKQAAKK